MALLLEIFPQIFFFVQSLTLIECIQKSHYDLLLDVCQLNVYGSLFICLFNYTPQDHPIRPLEGITQVKFFYYILNNIFKMR